MKSVIARGVRWGGLYGAFIGAAVLLRQQMMSSGVNEVWGWDYRTFVSQIGDWRWIGYFGFRHPGLGLVMSPLVALEHVWSGAYLVVMPAVASVTAWMIWRLSGWVGLLVWMCFPVTWIMAGTPESFPMAQMVLVGSCYWFLNGKSIAAHFGRGFQPFVCGVLAFFNMTITLTNGVKPIMGYLSLYGRQMDRKVLLRGGLLALALVLLGVGLFYVRTIVTGRGMGAGIMATLTWIPAERNLWFELYGFFVRPVGVVQSCLVYPMAVWAVIRMVHGRDLELLRLLVPMFAVDAVLHLVVGWGMQEPWVFSPHWVWMIPLLIGRSLKVVCK